MLLIHSSSESTGIEHCEYSFANQYAVPIRAIRNVYNNQLSMLLIVLMEHCKNSNSYFFLPQSVISREYNARIAEACTE